MSSSNKYFIFMFISLILMILISGYMFYQLWPKYTSRGFSFFNFHKEKKFIYILKSRDTVSYLDDTLKNVYLHNIQKLATKLKNNGFNPIIIDENSIEKLSSNEVLFAPDTYNLTNIHFLKLKKFISKGGNVIFNYRFAYKIDKTFYGLKNIEELTGLKHYKKFSNIKTAFFIPKLLSPLSYSSPQTRRMEFHIYGNDYIDLFKSHNTPDAVLINWPVTSTLQLGDKSLELNKAGVFWHGIYKKGKWVYSSLPLYAFLDLPDSDFKFLFDNLYRFLSNDISMMPYPFIQSKSAVFVSEDTEYKYENMIHFAKLAKEKNINTTLFCVAKLAQKHKKITQQASKFKNIEIASHSYSHTKIIGASEDVVKQEIIKSKIVLESITGKKIYGFRPPREEIDPIIEKYLIDAEYKYVMEKAGKYSLPQLKSKLVVISRHGTDDYAYIINSDWNKSKILQNIIKETNTLKNINSLYTLSVHTHLLSNPKNLDVLAKYFDYLKGQNISTLKGIDIAKKTQILSNLKITTEHFANKLVVTISNESDYPIINGKFRILHPGISIKKISSELINTEVSVINSHKEYTDVKINKIPPKTSTIIFVSY